MAGHCPARLSEDEGSQLKRRLSGYWKTIGPVWLIENQLKKIETNWKEIESAFSINALLVYFNDKLITSAICTASVEHAAYISNCFMKHTIKPHF